VSRISVRGVDLWVDQAGDGDDLLFIAGLADEGSCWADQAADLSDSYRVTTFDNRGVGRSSTPEGAYQIIDFADDTLALMDALGIARAHVVGSSMGGAIAQELTLRCPERVKSLVLHGTWCASDAYFREAVRSWQILARGAPSQREFFLAVNVWFVAPYVYDDGTIEKWVSAAEESPHPQSVDAFCRSAEALLTHDTRARLGMVSCPTLVTVGSLDICTPPRFARQLVELIPGADMHVFEGAGHMPYLEDPSSFTAVVRRFLSGK
jgi:pimeloyl-ACP methyl ester carboxylesterase